MSSNPKDQLLRKTSRQQSKPDQTAYKELPTKIFIERESCLTLLLRNEHIKCLYHINIVVTLIYMLNSACHDYLTQGRPSFGLRTFRAGYRDIHCVAGAWLTAHMLLLIFYYGYGLWTHVRARLAKQPLLRRLWSLCCLMLHISAQLFFGYTGCWLCLRWQLPFVSAIVLLLECVRLLMKLHAFVRHNAPQARLPSLAAFCYFLFAPTLLYRDCYPRSTHVRYGYALRRLLELLSIAFLYAFIQERGISVAYAHYSVQPLNLPALLGSFYSLILPSALLFVCGFYLLLHAWLNLTAELLRFGDRRFYAEWWSVQCFADFYRKWNIVVHDWLYEYVYRDVYQHVFPGSRTKATLVVFLLSALVHELIIGIALGVFLPVMFVLFVGFGVPLLFIMRRNVFKTLGNIFIWFSLILSSGILINLYAIEFYAKLNCPSFGASGIYPAMWRCYVRQLKI